MDLDQYRIDRRLSWHELAQLIGVRQGKQARAYALGHDWPRAERLQAIVQATGGAVTVEAMHQRRLRVERERAADLPRAS